MLATVVNLIIVLVGLIAWDRLTIREFPNVDDPVVTITTNYLGANAEIIESQVTKPLEDGISGIEGIDYISSISRAEQSQISVRFSTGRDPDAAANDVRDRVARARSFLPKEIDNPIVAKVESDATPIIYMAINSDRHNEMELTDYADRVVKDRLEVLPGVAQLLIIGRTALFDAGLARSRAARRVFADARRRRARADRTERRGSGRSHREQRPRIHGAVGNRSADAGAVLADHPERRRRLSGAPRRRRARRGGAGTGAQHVARVGPPRDRTRSHQAVHRESARRRAGAARRTRRS